MRNTRCFIAVDLPQELKQMLDEYLHGLRKLSPGVRWVRAGSIHITLKFLGEVSAEQLVRIREALEPVGERIQTFELRVAQFGAFPSRHRPRVVWLGLEGIPQKTLYNLQAQIEDALKEMGFEREKRRFSPHLTLGRIKVPTDLADVWSRFEQDPFPEYRFRVGEFVLMKSDLKPSGAVYTPIQKYSLRTL